MKRYLLIFVFIAAMSKVAVGPFSNLGFDEANTNYFFDLNGNNTYFYGPMASYFPAGSFRWEPMPSRQMI